MNPFSHLPPAPTRVTSPGLALVTGAARRIGAAMARHLAGQGWTVALHYHTATEAAADTLAEIRRSAPQSQAFAQDLSQTEGADALMDTIETAMGLPTLLINNASRFVPDTWGTVTPESWQAHMTVNLWTPLRLIRRIMQGTVINILDAFAINYPHPHFFSYSLSKAGLEQLTRNAARDCAPSVRVNGIAPGYVMPGHRQSQRHFDACVATTRQGIPTSVAEICAAMDLILATPAMTGTVIPLDSGGIEGLACEFFTS